MGNTKHIDIKKTLLRLRSKEVLVFMFFLAISAVFWLMSTLNETYETEVKVPLKLDGIPKKVVITDELPDTIKFTIRDKGFNLLRYSLFEPPHTISLSFQRYAGKNGRGNVIPSDVQKLLRQQLSESTSIVNVKADHWDFFYTHGELRRLPILMSGQVKAAADYYVLRTTITPDSVDVYASQEAFDTIHAIYMEPLMIDGLTASITKEVGLQHIYGTKINRKPTVSLTAIVDQLTEVLVSVPIKTVNVPNNIMIKTFPARVDVRVSVGMSNVKVVKPELFSVVADYKDVPSNSQLRFPLRLTSWPKGIVKAYLKIDEVDYIIEHLNP